jgi:hypothetical protein
MPLNPIEVARAMAGGLSAVCATCERYWAAQERHLDRCLATSGCCSPLGGGTFPEYQGPLNDEAFKQFCFVCGEKSFRAVRVGQSKRLVGVCRDHLVLFQKLQPVGKPAPHVTDLTTAVDDRPVEALLPKPRKTLAAAIAEADAYLDEQEKRGA